MILVTATLLKNTKIIAITLFPFILLRSRDLRQDVLLLNHERIHLRQQAELLLIFFYVWYVMEYFLRLLKTRNRFLAYKMISFEREAFAHEHDPDYLAKRRFWAFLKYV